MNIYVVRKYFHMWLCTLYNLRTFKGLSLKEEAEPITVYQNEYPVHYVFV